MTKQTQKSVDKWMAKVRAWAASHPQRNHVVDDNRERFYENTEKSSMKDLIWALEIRNKYNQMDLVDFVATFEEFTGQKVPLKDVDDFRLTGLNNIDFLLANWPEKERQ